MLAQDRLVLVCQTVHLVVVAGALGDPGSAVGAQPSFSSGPIIAFDLKLSGSYQLDKQGNLAFPHGSAELRVSPFRSEEDTIFCSV